MLNKYNFNFSAICAAKCAKNADCEFEDKELVCSCPAGKTGNPHIDCLPYAIWNVSSNFLSNKFYMHNVEMNFYSHDITLI